MEIAIEPVLGLALFVPLAAAVPTRTSAPAGRWAGINSDNVVDVQGNLRWWTRPRRKARGKMCRQSLGPCSSPSRMRQFPQRIG
jgi:hypothetical protein